MLRYDLHCHSTASDGLLEPDAMVRLAAERGVDVLALTDHDDTAGLAVAGAAAREAGIELVRGAEVSVSWDDETIHVVALRIDPECETLAAGLHAVRSGRDARARRIAAALEAVGVRGAWEGALRYVTSERLISRAHFARYLVEAGYVRDSRDVFKRYLARGLPGYVEHAWATLADAIAWIRAAGGVAVLAHPGRYRIGARGMRRLVAEFRERGGDAIEVLSPSHDADDVARFAALARRHGLKASQGSDYHGPGESFIEPGDLPELPAGLRPVWSSW
ncbi:MAG: PHP domain-containing protein [Burkholderiales bacterium]|nr:PHP domain-containing protein [Burkholderiales bacterium]